MKKFLLILLIVFLAFGQTSTVSAKSKVKSTYVYITRTGNKYHTSKCKYLKKSKKKVRLTTTLKKEYKPCNKCCHK